MINILLFVLCLVTNSISHSIDGIQNIKEDLELERQLKLVNKHPIKSIHTKFGDIVDCIDINKQPTFDHPLLKNHKLQRKPNFQKSIEKTSVKNSLARPIFRLKKVKCPTGTVPIRRTTKNDLIRDKSLLNDHIMTQGNPGTHRDNFKKTGCYNIRCPGFVQTHKGYYLGSRVDDTSIYGGKIVEFSISITQDPVTQNWWLHIGNENIGYYPAMLFSNMTSAHQVGWGGRTKTPFGAPSPQMGSGYFPDNNFVHACYFRFVSFQNASRQDYGPQYYQVKTFTDKPDCFGVKYYGNQRGEVGYSLQFGGPGGNCGN
ncbi:hypothetical protein E2542_SST21150 [Spatholobus suberectus]|nr:hypothetical protein E2542_SST21150 [Spatholobus suberectus]